MIEIFWEFNNLFCKIPNFLYFSEMKFMDFSRTYQGQNNILQALPNCYLVYIVNALFYDKTTSHTSNYNIHHEKHRSPDQ